MFILPLWNYCFVYTEYVLYELCTEAVSFGLYNFLYNFYADYLSPFHIIYDEAGTYANSYLVW